MYIGINNFLYVIHIKCLFLSKNVNNLIKDPLSIVFKAT